MIGTHHVFFKATPSIDYINEHPVHVFECCAKHCKGKVNGRMVHHYLDTSDAKSTGNLRKHARVCWGAEAMAVADEARKIGAAFKALKKLKMGQLLEPLNK